MSGSLDHLSTTSEHVNKLVRNMERVIVGKSLPIRLAVATLLAGGHILVEDVPGVGKTKLAQALARSIGGSFSRVQFTSDLLPSDVVGVTIYNQTRESFEFKRGPIFASVVLADEINRTTPRTQSCLLEAMSEGQVSVDDTTYSLGTPFMVIATQNPVEHHGTYPLPESQMDRFLMRIRIGYPTPEEEATIMRLGGGPLDPGELNAVLSCEEVRALQAQVDGVEVDEELVEYMMEVVTATRQSPMVELGVSTRGAIAYYRGVQAHALVQGRRYCIPEDCKDLALPLLAHRLVLANRQDSLGRTRYEAERVLLDILEGLTVPH